MYIPSMTFLKQLYHQMGDRQMTQCVFPYAFKHVKFSILFDTEENPFSLLFGVIQDNLVFSFKVERGFLIKDPTIERSVYKKLLKILQLKYNPDNQFSPSAFLETFNKEASVGDKCMKQPGYKDRRPFFSDVEEADKIYFKNWLPHQGERNVTEKNLEKTRNWLGYLAYQNCKEKNISSCWTANKIEESNPS